VRGKDLEPQRTRSQDRDSRQWAQGGVYCQEDARVASRHQRVLTQMT